MSNIDTYNKIKQENTNSIQQLRYVMQQKADGTPDPYNDKGYMTFCDSKIWDTDMKISCHASYGYYGSSSEYEVGGENIKKYILQVLNSMKSTIINKSIELMQNDTEKARLECVEEAKAILEQTKI